MNKEVRKRFFYTSSQFRLVLEEVKRAAKNAIKNSTYKIINQDRFGNENVNINFGID